MIRNNGFFLATKGSASGVAKGFATGLCLVVLTVLAGCGSTNISYHAQNTTVPPRSTPDLSGKDMAGELPDFQASGGYYKIGSSYKIKGKRYQPREDFYYDQVGIASWYGPGFHGKKTANGEIFNQDALTAAHKTLQLPTMARVTNLENNRSIIVRINDRGPFAHDRILDLSKRAAELLGVIRNGTARVRVSVLPEESKRLKAAMLGEEVAPLQPVKVASAAPIALSDAIEVDSPEPALTAAPLVPSFFVQAGSFASADNAQRLKQELSWIAPLTIEPASVNGMTVFRVRLGPLTTPEDANIMLSRVIAAGYSNARIVTE